MTWRGLGKFGHFFDEAAYMASLDGAGEESAGDVTEFGVYFEKLGGPLHYLREYAEGLDLDDMQRRELSKLIRENAGGVILSEDDQGFVSTSIYTTKEELDEAWDEILERLATIEGEFDEDDDDMDLYDGDDYISDDYDDEY